MQYPDARQALARVLCKELEEPGAGKPHVRIDQRGEEAEAMTSYSATSVPKGLVSAIGFA